MMEKLELLAQPSMSTTFDQLITVLTNTLIHDYFLSLHSTMNTSEIEAIGGVWRREYLFLRLQESEGGNYSRTS